MTKTNDSPTTTRPGPQARERRRGNTGFTIVHPPRRAVPSAPSPVSIRARKSRGPAPKRACLRLVAAGLLLFHGAVPAVAGPRGARESASGLRGAAVGKLHDAILLELIAAELPVSSEPTPAELGLVLDAAGVAAWKAVDLEKLGRELGVDEARARIFLDIVVGDTKARFLELAESSGAYAEDPQQTGRRLRPMGEALELMLVELAARGEISDDFAWEVIDIARLARDSQEPGLGDVMREMRSRLGGSRWQGAERLGADAMMSIFSQSEQLWSALARRAGLDGDELPSTHDWKETAAADAVGGVIGGLLGGIGGAAAGLAIGVATGGAGLLLVPVGAGAGAGAGAALGGGTTSLIEALKDDGPAQPCSCDGGDSGGDSGGDTGGDTGGDSGGGDTGGGDSGGGDSGGGN